jgi:hypothetical protein
MRRKTNRARSTGGGRAGHDPNFSGRPRNRGPGECVVRCQGLYDEAKKRNWTAISMKTDWKRVFVFVDVGYWHQTDHWAGLIMSDDWVDRKWSARRQTGAFDPTQTWERRQSLRLRG